MDSRGYKNAIQYIYIVDDSLRPYMYRINMYESKCWTYLSYKLCYTTVVLGLVSTDFRLFVMFFNSLPENKKNNK